MVHALSEFTRGLHETLQNKIVSFAGAVGLVVSGEVSKPTYVNLAEDGFLWFTYAGWMQVIGCLWISILILEKCKVFRGVAWIYKTLKGGE